MAKDSRTEMTLQYEPLVNKLTAQFYHKVKYDWDEIKSMAYEGLVLAMNKYDKSRSNMSFVSYAAFYMRNNIMTRLTEESRTVVLPFEEQKRRTEAGLTNFTSLSIDRKYNGDDDDVKPRETVMGMVTPAKFDDGDVFECLYTKLENKFPIQTCEMFYMSYGLRGYEETPNQDIAKKFKLTPGRVSQKKKDIIEYIRKDRDICEMLTNLF